MERIASQKASEIERPARQWLQRLLGRSIGEDEQVTIFVATPHTAPAIGDRQTAFRSMNEVLDKSARNMQGISDAEFDETVDESLQQIRKRPN